MNRLSIAKCNCASTADVDMQACPDMLVYHETQEPL